MCTEMLDCAIRSRGTYFQPPAGQSSDKLFLAQPQQPAGGAVTVRLGDDWASSVPGLAFLSPSLSLSLSQYDPILASPAASVVLGLGERIRYLLAAVDGADQHD